MWCMAIGLRSGSADRVRTVFTSRFKPTDFRTSLTCGAHGHDSDRGVRWGPWGVHAV